MIATMPTTGIQKVRFVLQSNSRLFTSPLTGTGQTLDLLGTRWLASYTLPPLKAADAGAWIGFLTRLMGKAGRFYAYDPSAIAPRGTATGTPKVRGGGQGGIRLETDGWTINLPVALAVGDYVAWDTPSGWRELHKVTATAPSGGTGRATLLIAPAIREAPVDDADLILTRASCVMRLATDDDGRWNVDEAKIYTISFNAEEVFSASVG